MSSSSSTIEQLPANIPRLEPNGSNWAIFLMRFRQAMQATRRWGYFDGTTPCPVPKRNNKMMDNEKEDIAKWEHKDLITCYLLSQCLPDTTALRLGNIATVKECWMKVSTEFTAKSAYA